MREDRSLHPPPRQKAVQPPPGPVHHDFPGDRLSCLRPRHYLQGASGAREKEILPGRACPVPLDEVRSLCHEALHKDAPRDLNGISTCSARLSMPSRNLVSRSRLNFPAPGRSPGSLYTACSRAAGAGDESVWPDPVCHQRYGDAGYRTGSAVIYAGNRRRIHACHLCTQQWRSGPDRVTFPGREVLAQTGNDRLGTGEPAGNEKTSQAYCVWSRNITGGIRISNRAPFPGCAGSAFQGR